MERKLFAFDIDGTLLNSEKKALDSTREALAKLREQGHLVTLATGRSRYMAQEVIWDLDFTNTYYVMAPRLLWIMSNIIKIYCTLKRWNVWHKTVINAA